MNEWGRGKIVSVNKEPNNPYFALCPLCLGNLSDLWGLCHCLTNDLRLYRHELLFSGALSSPYCQCIMLMLSSG